MADLRPVIAALLVLLAAPVGAAVYILVLESATSMAVAASAIVLLAILAIGIGRGLLARERATTAYW